MRKHDWIQQAGSSPKGPKDRAGPCPELGPGSNPKPSPDPHHSLQRCLTFKNQVPTYQSQALESGIPLQAEVAFHNNDAAGPAAIQGHRAILSKEQGIPTSGASQGPSSWHDRGKPFAPRSLQELRTGEKSEVWDGGPGTLPGRVRVQQGPIRERGAMGKEGIQNNAVLFANLRRPVLGRFKETTTLKNAPHLTVETSTHLTTGPEGTHPGGWIKAPTYPGPPPFPFPTQTSPRSLNKEILSIDPTNCAPEDEPILRLARRQWTTRPRHPDPSEHRFLP